jgi:hypothetical protein
LQVKQVYVLPTTNIIAKLLLHLQVPAVGFHTKAALKQLQFVALSLDKA